MKERHNPEKAQNNYGGDYECPNYDVLSSGKELCHQECGPNVEWDQYNKEGKLVCKGNLHNCGKLKYKWLASTVEK